MNTPHHVAPELIKDFDFNLPNHGIDIFLDYKKLHSGPEIFWTPKNGGHWVATRGEDIVRILSSHEEFSSRYVFLPIIENRPPIVPMELDPPEHRPYRRMVDDVLKPSKMLKLEASIRALAHELIESCAEKKSFEFMTDFARKLPVNIFLMMCDIPFADRDQLIEWVDASIRPSSFEESQVAVQKMSTYIDELIRARRAELKEDAISTLIQATKDNGEHHLHALIWGLLGGGLDTVGASMGWAAYHFLHKPESQKELHDHPEWIENASEEIFRRYSVATIARIVKNDMNYKGIKFKSGDGILLPACLHALDEDCFENPLEVIWDRKNARTHSTFSQGIHSCPGRFLAKLEMKIFFEEWLKQCHRFEIDPTRTITSKAGIVHSLVQLPLRVRGE